MRTRPSPRVRNNADTAVPAIMALFTLVTVLIVPGCGEQSAPEESSSLNKTDKSSPDSEAEKRSLAEITAAETSGPKTAADETVTDASGRTLDKRSVTGFTYSPARAAEIARMQEQNLASIRPGHAASLEAAGSEINNAAVESGREKTGQAIAGFTYSDEHALEMRTALANLRNRRSDNARGDKPGQLLNAFGQELGDFFAHRLPNGEVIMIPEHGFEEKFLSALGSEAGPGSNVYTLDRIFFATGSVALDRESTDQIESIAAILRAYRNLGFLIRGHTDNRGSTESNIELSKQRADAVEEALVELGIDATRMQTTGAGSSEPLESNETPEGRRMNRRIDITVM